MKEYHSPLSFIFSLCREFNIFFFFFGCVCLSLLRLPFVEAQKMLKYSSTREKERSKVNESTSAEPMIVLTLTVIIGRPKKKN